jgi:hypothetical protein
MLIYDIFMCKASLHKAALEILSCVKQGFLVWYFYLFLYDRSLCKEALHIKYYTRTNKNTKTGKPYLHKIKFLEQLMQGSLTHKIQYKNK